LIAITLILSQFNRLRLLKKLIDYNHPMSAS